VDTKRPAKSVIEAMAQQNVMIGRVWPVMPSWTRITVGTHEEMLHFQVAFKKVMDGTVAIPASSSSSQAAWAYRWENRAA
jgi:histidinol-phosphate/aromatic aminotransferase/cobyric acid decarboxylase-like protein